jgi:hypothetical protein
MKDSSVSSSNVNLQLNDEANKCVVCGGEITRDETLCIVDDGANPLVQRMSEVEGTIRMRILCFEVSKVSKVSRSSVRSCPANGSFPPSYLFAFALLLPTTVTPPVI